VVLGIGLGLFYASLPEHHPQRDRNSCESIGGEWSDEQGVCLLSFKEAGEPCTDGGQCTSGVCSPQVLTDEQMIRLDEGPLTGIMGVCHPDDQLTGCVEQVIMGTISKGSMCR
ncbi:MAG: hypothetical protein ABIH41_01335, partial [Nanoarchaeota archaeon]